jgi:type II pantothenate kinase
MYIGIDFGTTNTDAVCVEFSRSSMPSSIQILHRWTLPALPLPDESSIEIVLRAGGVDISSVQQIAITGGNRSRIPTHFREHCVISQHTEIESIGRGGLFLSGAAAAIIVSAGSGTAVVKAQAGTATEPFHAAHVTGTGIGGGTLMGLGRLIVHSHNPQTIDQLALDGRAEAVNLTIQDVLGGPLGRIPPDATAVNFGRVARASASNDIQFRTEDLAAALVELVSQAIAVTGINAARAHGLSDIVIVGHLTDMKSIHAIFGRIAEFSGVKMHIVSHGGYAVAIGVVLCSIAPVIPTLPTLR